MSLYDHAPIRARLAVPLVAALVHCFVAVTVVVAGSSPRLTTGGGPSAGLAPFGVSCLGLEGSRPSGNVSSWGLSRACVLRGGSESEDTLSRGESRSNSTSTSPIPTITPTTANVNGNNASGSLVGAIEAASNETMNGSSVTNGPRVQILARAACHRQRGVAENTRNQGQHCSCVELNVVQLSSTDTPSG